MPKVANDQPKTIDKLELFRDVKTISNKFSDAHFEAMNQVVQVLNFEDWEPGVVQEGYRQTITSLREHIDILQNSLSDLVEKYGEVEGA